MLDESPLTGESLPVARAEGERVLSGSFCVEGSGGYVVTGTGAESYAWQLLGTAREDTAQRSPLEQQINQLLRLLVAVMVPLGAALVWSLAARRHPLPRGRRDRHRRHRHHDPRGAGAADEPHLRGRRRAAVAQGHARAVHERDRVAGQRRHRLPGQDRHAHRRQPGAVQRCPAGRRRGGATSARSWPATRPAPSPATPPWTPSPPACRARPRPRWTEVPFSSRWKWSGIRREDGWLVLGAPDVLLAGRLPAEVSGHEQEGRRVLAFGRAGAGRVPGRWRWRHAPDRAAGAGGAGGAAARRRRRHDRLPAPPGRRREGDVGRLAGDGGGRRRARRRPRGRHAQAGVRPARGPRRAGGRGARGDGVRAAHARPQACPGRGADRSRRLRGHDRRRRQRRAGDEGGAAGGGPGQRHASWPRASPTACW